MSNEAVPLALLRLAALPLLPRYDPRKYALPGVVPAASVVVAATAFRPPPLDLELLRTVPALLSAWVLLVLRVPLVALMLLVPLAALLLTLMPAVPVLLVPVVVPLVPLR